MNIAHIVPPQWEGVFSCGGYRMALAHWVLEYPKYAKQLKAGDQSYLLLDNGTFENQQVDIAKLNSAFADAGADEVVLPDAHGNPGETLRRSWKALSALSAKRVMFVPQGTTQVEWESCLKAWVEKWNNALGQTNVRDTFSLAIGVTSLRKEVGKREPQIGTRAPLLKRYFSLNLPYPVHLLGIPDPQEFAASELPLAATLGVRGVDTSTAFALACKGKLLTPTIGKVHLGEPDQYEMLTTSQRRLVRLNQHILSTWVEAGEAKEAIPTYLIRQVASKWLKYWGEGFEKLGVVMEACGMPKGKYALCKLRGREMYIRPLGVLEGPGQDEQVIKIGR